MESFPGGSANVDAAPVIINGQMTEYLSVFFDEVDKYDKKKYSFSISGNFFQELLI